MLRIEPAADERHFESLGEEAVSEAAIEFEGERALDQ